MQSIATYILDTRMFSGQRTGNTSLHNQASDLCVNITNADALSTRMYI